MEKKTKITDDMITSSIVTVFKITRLDQIKEIFNQLDKLPYSSKDTPDTVTWFDICKNILPSSDHRSVKSYIDTCRSRFNNKRADFDKYVRELVGKNIAQDNANANLVEKITRARNEFFIELDRSVSLKKRIRICSYDLSQTDFFTLRKSEKGMKVTDLWVTSSVINAFSAMQVSVARKNKLDIEDIDCLITSGMMELIANSQDYCIRLPSNVRNNRWWLFPVRVNGDHWVLAFVDRLTKIFVYLDSAPSGLKENDHQVLLGNHKNKKNLKSLLKIIGHFEHRQQLSDKEWTIFTPRDVAQQMDGYNCGIFVCVWTYIICNSSCMTFSNPDMNPARDAILQRLLSNHGCVREKPSQFTRAERSREKCKLSERKQEINDDKTIVYYSPPDGCQTTLEYLSRVLTT